MGIVVVAPLAASGETVSPVAAIAAKTTRDSGLACEASQVVVTNGAKQAVAETFQALLDPGDEVLLPAPYWTTYPEAIALTGAPQSGLTGPSIGATMRFATAAGA